MRFVALSCGILGMFGILSCPEPGSQSPLDPPNPINPPTNSDLDKDGIYDEYDYCPDGESAWVSDASTDIDSDGCEDSSEDIDDDNDTVSDDNDACPTHPVILDDGQLWQSDSTTDVDMNGCRDSDQDTDSDSDGHIDGIDNCPFMLNTNQTDNDRDNIGDVCDDDDDNDTIPDSDDACPLRFIVLDNGQTWQSDSATDANMDGCHDSEQDGDDDGYSDFEDIDDDNDGLIDIYSLEDLNNIRFNLTGTSYTTGVGGEGNTSGAPTVGTDVCTKNVGTASNPVYLCGYELARSLDFANSAHYASGIVNNDWRPNSSDSETATNVGWIPIGSYDNSFSAIFDGNDYTISSLYIKRTTSADSGLFSVVGTVSGTSTSPRGYVRNVGVINSYVRGANWTGIATGQLGAFSEIVNVYVAGVVYGSNHVGGLAGRNHGGKIAHSYSTGATVSGEGSIGGLVGRNAGTISASYSTVLTVAGTTYVGGLTGYLVAFATINTSYATGSVSGNSFTGGLAGFAATGSGYISNSAYNIATNGLGNAVNGAPYGGVSALDQGGLQIVCDSTITIGICALGASFYYNPNACTFYPRVYKQSSSATLVGGQDMLTTSDGCDGSTQDTDGDGVIDAEDLCTNIIPGWMSDDAGDNDGDGCQDNSEDSDDDNDGITDTLDVCPLGLIDLGGGVTWTSSPVSDFDTDGCHDTIEDSEICQLAIDSARCNTLRSYKNILLATFPTTLSLSSGGILPGGTTPLAGELPSNFAITKWHTNRDDLPLTSGRVAIKGWYKFYYTVFRAPIAYTTTIAAAITTTIDTYSVTDTVSKQYTVPAAPAYKTAHTASTAAAEHYLYFEDDFSLGEINYAKWLGFNDPCNELIEIVGTSLRITLNYVNGAICNTIFRTQYPLTDGFYEFKHKTNGNYPGVRRSFWAYNAVNNGQFTLPETDILEYILNTQGPHAHCGIHYYNSLGQQTQASIKFGKKNYDFGTNTWITTRSTHQPGWYYVTHTKSGVTKSFCDFSESITQYSVGHNFYLRLGMDKTGWGSQFNPNTFPDDGATWDFEYIRFYRRLSDY